MLGEMIMHKLFVRTIFVYFIFKIKKIINTFSKGLLVISIICKFSKHDKSFGNFVRKLLLISISIKSLQFWKR